MSRITKYVDKDKLIELYKSGVNMQDLSKEFNVSPLTIKARLTDLGMFSPDNPLPDFGIVAYDESAGKAVAMFSDIEEAKKYTKKSGLVLIERERYSVVVAALKAISGIERS